MLKEDPYLKELAAKLLHSREDSMVWKYLGGFKQWETWDAKYGITAIPAKVSQAL